MSSLVVAASLVQFALAFWLAQLRRVITPVVSGVAFMLISASAMPIAIARLENVPADVSPLAGPIVGAAALIAAAILMLRATGILRLFAIPITIAAGWIIAIPLGVFDFRSALDAPWFGLPQFSAWPGFSAIRLRRLSRTASRLPHRQHRRGNKGQQRGGRYSAGVLADPARRRLSRRTRDAQRKRRRHTARRHRWYAPPTQLSAFLDSAHQLHLRRRTPRRFCDRSHAHRHRTPAQDRRRSTHYPPTRYRCDSHDRDGSTVRRRESARFYKTVSASRRRSLSGWRSPSASGCRRTTFWPNHSGASGEWRSATASSSASLPQS